ncbi:hypothetical protein GON26_21090 [Flavobacterium sp. GA093]|uniref:HTH araC/xylS-type domain-containing protein n=1 Tax=Flavobacterium hydrocarbonoxydans TaxID=2683249 RepID=A0A6I4P182_9FLAO|nr:hypothetical protein [Flavobacterium hydrocarbonoxydans]MWB96864.1 hypothetical protein [Flavobacterium hydrocarbonoxydans]
MKSLYLNAGGFNSIFNNLKESLSGELTIENNEYNLVVNSKLARGTIKGVSFEKELLSMEFDLFFNDDVSLSIEAHHAAPIYFAYCDKGVLQHSFGSNGERQVLKAQQSGVLNNSTAINSVLHFESHKKIQFSLIGVPTNTSNELVDVDFTKQLKKMFSNTTGQYFYTGTQHAKITEKLEELKAIPQKGMVRSILKKTILKSILAQEIELHSYNYLKTFDPIVNLATRQINEIKKLSQINIYETIHALGFSAKGYLPRVFKEKYHISIGHKGYNQKLAS